MNDSVDPNVKIIDRSLDKGLYVKEDDQDWGSAGMNDVKKTPSKVKKIYKKNL